MSIPEWKPLQKLSGESLTEARLQLHWASQIPASVGSLLEPAVDWSHTALRWSNGALQSPAIPFGDRSFRANLSLKSLQLGLLQGDRVIDRKPLAGSTLKEGFAWLNKATQALINAPLAKTMMRSELTLPKHPLQTGARFELDKNQAQISMLADWIFDADLALSTIRKEITDARDVYVWPHHFDAASLVVLDPDKPFEDTRSIGLGLSPGDQNYDQPYWYVQPWPYPKVDALPKLAGGRWHTENWVGAVLLASDLGDAQDAQVLDFLRSGFRGASSVMD